MYNSKSLLEKYHIPIEHIDFEYVRNCVNVKEIERILEILKSGEEGHFPELIEFTGNRLRELDPANKMFRVEHNLVRGSNPECRKVQEEVEAFVTKVKQQRSSVVSDVELDQFLPPVRKVNEKTAVTARKQSNRIKSCDYDQWNKYDPDTECLKMDLHEEKIREDLLQHKKKQKQLIEIMPSTSATLIDHLTDEERKSIADGHRLKGNEFFRSAEYELAISEYTKCMTFAETAAAFNNRAAAYIKMKKYSQAISDCDECLSIEPNNVKAMLRRAEALNASGHKNDAYRQYNRVLEVDPGNLMAKKTMENIPVRLEIEDIRFDKNPENRKPETKIISKPPVYDDCDDELRKLIIPKKIVRSKLSQAVSNIKQLCSDPKPQKNC